LREALAEYDRVQQRMLAKVDEALREQYPEGTDVRWGHTAKGPWHIGRALEKDENRADGMLPVRNYVRGPDQITSISVRQILWGGDAE
jgi:hypothetical protein